jgi:hypothetical protein
MTKTSLIADRGAVQPSLAIACCQLPPGNGALSYKRFAHRVYRKSPMLSATNAILDLYSLEPVMNFC